MKRVIYNVEVYINFFSLSIENFNTDEVIEFEISERQNDLIKIVNFFKSLEFAIGFNNQNYDNLIVNYLIKHFNRLSTSVVSVINKELKRLNDFIVYDNNRDNRVNYDEYKRYIYDFPATSIDIFLFWSKMLRISKKLSLNTLACNINYPLIQEQLIDTDKILTLKEFDVIKKHGTRNTNITKKLANLLVNDINLRLAANRRYGFKCFSWDGVKIGLHILIRRYCQKTEQDETIVKQLRTHVDSVELKDIIFDNIKFEHQDDLEPIYYTLKGKSYVRYKSFHALLHYLKDLKVYGTQEISVEVMFDGVRYDIKSGGLHSYHKPSIIVPLDDEDYEDIDVSSYYPTLGSEWDATPDHLGVEFAMELSATKEERLELKRKGLGKSSEAELLKLALNGGYYGNLNSQWTCMYDWKQTLKVTVNGQLFLLMLCEQLVKIGVTIDMCNTDGVTIRYKKVLKEQVKQIIKDWEVNTRMEMESVTYLKVVRANINNYMAIYEDKGKIKVKEKGYFISEPLGDPFMELSRSHDFEIISKALRNYFKDGVPIEEFIRNHKNIYDFCASYKVEKKYTVTWRNKKQQRLNRFYVSDKGAYLYKRNPDSKDDENMLKGFAVQIFNEFVEKPIEKYNINYQYYIQKTREIIEEFEPKQGKLL